MPGRHRLHDVIAGLALDAAALDAAKVGILCASLLSGALGMFLLAKFAPDEENA